eukprot:gene9161-3347_t
MSIPGETPEQKLSAFYAWREPAKVNEVPTIIEAYREQHEATAFRELFDELGGLYPGCTGWSAARDALAAHYHHNAGRAGATAAADAEITAWHTGRGGQPPDGGGVGGCFTQFYADMDAKHADAAGYFAARLQLVTLWQQHDGPGYYRRTAGTHEALAPYRGRWAACPQEWQAWFTGVANQSRDWVASYYQRHNPSKAGNAAMLVNDTPVYAGVDGKRALMMGLLKTYEPAVYTPLATWSAQHPQPAAAGQLRDALREFMEHRMEDRVHTLGVILDAYGHDPAGL